MGFNVKSIFAPEHRFKINFGAGEKIKNDLYRGIPIYSLYGDNKKPTSNSLNNLDIILFDIQDVGVRFYTYISTLHYVMEACAENNIPLIVLDRDNLNSNYVDGPVLKPSFPYISINLSLLISLKFAGKLSDICLLSLSDVASNFWVSEDQE